MMMLLRSRSLAAAARVGANQHRVFSATTFDGDMARLYMNFFNQAEPAWKLTEEIVRDAQSTIEGNKPLGKILDIASGPGEPSLTLAKAHSQARVFCTDGAEAMNALAEGRVKDAGLESRISVHLMDLNDFSPVRSHAPFDLVTAQFALMFTEDFPGSLGCIHDSLSDEGGLLVGTVWEEFFILPLLKDTMTKVLGETPPPPPINPLSLADRSLVDDSLAAAGFKTIGRHNETAGITINIGAFENEDTIKTALLPVTPALIELEEKKGAGIMDIATDAMRDAIVSHGMINTDGDVEIHESTYRYIVAQKA